ncbi:HBS1-like protein [Portunus trituberculatus]|uniref:HBS1-like protein n=1 Tax=Portunus trituberculatus TaxID=210409 RepID=A0A5B7CYR5_PORTR|nr:HBS1-like protein [Portunus trituberculatus]
MSRHRDVRNLDYDEGVSQLVVAINKLDTVDWSEERMKEVRHSLRQFLKGVGYKDIDVTYVPCSGLSGENLVKRTPGEPLSAWYSGPTLLEAIDIQIDTQADNVAFAGDHITLTISGVDPAALHIGDFLCDPTSPIPLATKVQARIVVFNIVVPLIKGAQLDFHYQSVTEPATIRKLVSQLHKTTGQTLKSRPRALPKNSAGMVELEFSRPLCLELFRDFREMGRFMLRTGGTTIAAGLVTKTSPEHIPYPSHYAFMDRNRRQSYRALVSW